MTRRSGIKGVWEGVDRTAGPEACWPWTRTLNKAGYGYFRKDRRYYLAHRVALLGVEGARTETRLVRHLCNNPKCCNPAHLALGSYLDNSNDALLAGTVGTTLSLETIQKVLDMLWANVGYLRIGAEVGVTPGVVADVAESLGPGPRKRGKGSPAYVRGNDKPRSDRGVARPFRKSRLYVRTNNVWVSLDSEEA
jgi:hypothetical protein